MLGFRKYDHISQHYCALQWLPLGSEIQYRSFLQCTTSTFSLNTFHLYHQFSLVASINMRLELLSSLLSHQDVIYPLLNIFFRYKVIHWWNAVPIDILSLATFKDDLLLFIVCAIISLHACVASVLLYMCVVIFVCLHVCYICK